MRCLQPYTASFFTQSMAANDLVGLGMTSERSGRHAYTVVI